MNEATIRVQGLRELQRDLAAIDKGLRRELRTTLREAVEPVRADAEQLAAGAIRNIGTRWPLMKIGVTNTAVYVAPRQRRRGGSPRPNLAPLLMDRAMTPALDHNQEQIVVAVDMAINRVASENGF